RKDGHIPRPRNAFMFFRSDLCASGRLKERDHRQISRIAGHLWQKMPYDSRLPFLHLADIEKIQHKARYPGYKYAP
ncbi:high mobility group box domain-containing protein, partial [Irpex lacteus]